MRTVSRMAVTCVVCATCLTTTTAQDRSSRDSRSDNSSTIITPRQDQHDGLRISVDAYSQPARAKEKFGKANPLNVGILPVEVSLHNERNQPIHVDLSTIQLSVNFSDGHRQDIDWVPVQQVANQVAHPGGPSAPQARRFPIGIPSGADKKADQLADILRPLALDADVVPPMGTIHGFLFFDLNHNMSLAEGASLYVPDVTTIPPTKPLMFFEVPLGL
jgi:hypothetical protein